MRHQGQAVIFAVALLLAILDPPVTELFSLDRALMLAPFFALGMCVFRYWRLIVARRRIISCAAAAFCAFALGSAALNHFHEPLAEASHGIAQSLMIGMSICTLMLLNLPHHPAARRIGQFSFTIYLYHVFATSAARMGLEALGVTSLAIHVPVGIAAGIASPIALHLLLRRSTLTALIALGVRENAPLRHRRRAMTIGG